MTHVLNPFFRSYDYLWMSACGTRDWLLKGCSNQRLFRRCSKFEQNNLKFLNKFIYGAINFKLRNCHKNRRWWWCGIKITMDAIIIATLYIESSRYATVLLRTQNILYPILKHTFILCANWAISNGVPTRLTQHTIRHITALCK